MLLGGRGPPAVPQQIKVREADHHHHPVRPNLLLILQQRRQLVIKKESVVEPGFGVLSGIGADQRIHTAALLASEMDLGQQ